jgi:GNAT superfamily N-acetyltransferase
MWSATLEERSLATVTRPGIDVDIAPLSNRGRELDDAAMVAARAFHHDPFFEYLDPHGITRARGLALFWRSELASLGARTQLSGARTPDGRLVGVSAWLPPGTYPPPASSQVRQLAGAARAMALRPPALLRGLRYLLAIEKAHPKDPLWYLLLLVVDPSMQRSGIGARLQEEGMAAADKEGLDCYLETQKPENLVYYRRFGYEVDQELRPVNEGPSLWTMRRPAG